MNGDDTQGEPRDSGSTKDAPSNGVRVGPGRNDVERFEIARSLISLLALTLIIHYGLVFALIWTGKSSETLESLESIF